MHPEFQQLFPVVFASQAIDTIPLMFNLQKLVLYCTFPLTNTAPSYLAQTRGQVHMDVFRF